MDSIVDVAGDTRRLAARISDELANPPALTANLVHVTSLLAERTAWPDGQPLTTVDVATRLMDIATARCPLDLTHCHLVDILEGR